MTEARKQKPLEKTTLTGTVKAFELMTVELIREGATTRGQTGELGIPTYSMALYESQEKISTTLMSVW